MKTAAGTEFQVADIAQQHQKTTSIEKHPSVCPAIEQEYKTALL